MKIKLTASTFTRTVNCPAWHVLTDSIPKEQRFTPTYDWAIAGTNLHAIFARRNREEISNLPEKDRLFIEQALAQESLIIAKWRSADSVVTFSDPVFEKRLTLDANIDGIQFSITAIPDQYIIGESANGYKTALIIELKTIEPKHQHDPAENYQLVLQSLVVANEYPDIKKFYVALITNYPQKDPAIATYDRNGLDVILSDIATIVDRAQSAKPEDINPGYWCEYCPALGHCQKAITEHSNPVTAITKSPANEQAIVSKLTNEQCVEILDKKSIITRIFDAIEARLKALPDEELDKLGLKKSPNVRYEITDQKQLVDRIEKLDINIKDLLINIKLTKTGLTDAIKNTIGDKLGNPESVTQELLSGILTKKELPPKLIFKRK